MQPARIEPMTSCSTAGRTSRGGARRRRRALRGTTVPEFRRGQLESFVTVVEEGQITRAASRLHIAQPALSHAIAQLESELGVPLLDRHARGVTLTLAGERFYGKARLAVEADTDAHQTAQA